MTTLDKFLAGYFTGARAPYGFKLVPAESTDAHGRGRYRLEVGDAEEVETVDFIFAQFVHSGASRRQICNILNANGVKAPRGNRAWQPRLISAMLADERYIGTSCFGQLRRVNAFPPVISELIFRAAQVRLCVEREDRDQIARLWGTAAASEKAGAI